MSSTSGQQELIIREWYEPLTCILVHISNTLHPCSVFCDNTLGELFFPGEYLPMCSCPQNGWADVPPELKKCPLFNRTEGATIPIDKLGHVTHEQQAQSIKSDDYSFKPKPKCGKDYHNGSYRKLSETESTSTCTLQLIQHDEKVIEGNLSWWGVDTHSWFNSQDVRGKAFGAAVANLRSERIFVSKFILNPSESRYGNQGFVVGFKDLLKHYEQSRTDVVNIRDRAPFLRVGGTLRYRYEICYIVIVCTKHDKELDHYPSLYTRSDIFDHKGLLYPSGKIKRTFFTSQETVDFKLKHAIKCVPKQQRSCYEQPAFAFYYPEESTSCLKCPSEKITEVQAIHECDKLCQMKKAKYMEEVLDMLLNAL